MSPRQQLRMLLHTQEAGTASLQMRLMQQGAEVLRH